MASKSTVPFEERARQHPNPLAKQLFEIAVRKKTNIVLSADLRTSEELLAIADRLGPHIAVLKTHIDIVKGSSQAIEGLTALAKRHDFLLFEDRKFNDIGSILQMQYTDGDRALYDWAHLVTVTLLAGAGTVKALDETIRQGPIAERGMLLLAEMTSQGSLAVGEYTQRAVDMARKYFQTVVGFVATKELSRLAPNANLEEDFVVFTTGVNNASKGDALNQQYQTVTSAMEGGSDFLIVGRGLYAAKDPVAAAKEYQKAGWEAYKRRVKQ